MKQPLSANRAYRIANQAQTELLCGRAIEDFVRRKLFISELRNEPISRAGAQETQAFTDFQERSQFSQLSAAPAGHHPLRPPELRNEPISRAEAQETQALPIFRNEANSAHSQPPGRATIPFAPNNCGTNPFPARKPKKPKHYRFSGTKPIQPIFQPPEGPLPPSPSPPPKLRNEPISRAEAQETQAFTDFQERTQFSPFFSRPAGRRRPRFAPFLHPFAHLPHPLNVQS